MPSTPKTLREEIEKIYDCTFCERGKIWDIKKNKRIKCPHIDVTDQLEALTLKCEVEVRIDQCQRLRSLKDSSNDDYYNILIAEEVKLRAQLTAPNNEEEKT